MSLKRRYPRTSLLATRRIRRTARLRRGLAPLELVLWAPILMFVCALIVNFGTANAWRIRSEIASRDMASRAIAPRTGANEFSPPNSTWPRIGTSLSLTRDTSQTSAIDTMMQNYPVVRGPLGPIQATPYLDEDNEGLLKGTSRIRRPFTMLAKIGSYDSGEVPQWIRQEPWTIRHSYWRGVLNWPDEIGGIRPWQELPNVFRRTVLVYILPQFPGKAAFAAAVNQAIDLINNTGVRILDRDDEVRHYRGSYADFYPRAPVHPSLDTEEVRDQSLERHVIDYLVGTRVELGEVCRLPARLTSFYLSMYRQRISEIEAIIDAGGGTPALQAELADLKRKVEQLEAYQRRIPEIEDDLRKSSSAR